MVQDRDYRGGARGRVEVTGCVWGSQRAGLISIGAESSGDGQVFPATTRNYKGRDPARPFVSIVPDASLIRPDNTESNSSGTILPIPHFNNSAIHQINETQ
jgi:hypothetical protein